jgi:molybdopterin-synthase adenylyltransferase
MMFDYEQFTTRNIGFVTPQQQEKIRAAHVLVCGCGGMGGAAILALARAGIGRLTICDIDDFEVSNLNRQVFAWTDTVGRHKAVATAEQLRRINPEMSVEVLKDDWPEHLPRILQTASVVVNGTDDLGASLLLYRAARNAGLPVIDSYASPLPSVYVTRPADPSPEERLGYPTIGMAWNQLTDDARAKAFQAEAVYVMTNSSSAAHIDLDAVGEVVAGKRSRMSFAPMVITSGMLITYEALAIVTGAATATSCRGWFFNPYRGRVEHPRNPVAAAIVRLIVLRKLAKMTAS